MVIVDQYPHTIVVSSFEPVKDENGDYVTAEPTVIHSGKCRAEPNGKGEVLRGDNGSEINYSFTVYMPKTDIVFTYNSDVKIEIGNKLISGRVKRHSNGQLNSRVWV